ncbi:restriction endonuclease subunit S [Aliarcobacter thereius]|uniref:restriction endonuclease subunit S n=1 Tax=Aliarcobacter thereius TaxID=544718 RepID=UPI0008243120|nr:restriction endonuclease subunit S [Aliarcobacter thereius]OCL93699.1 Type I restriction modification DNA specificity domain protein [Aliarcobacter thereius]
MSKNINVPKLRFKEFSGEWEDKLFGEIYTFLQTNSFSRALLNYEFGEVKNIHYGDIHTKFKSNFYLEKENVPYINEDIDISKLTNDNFCREKDLVIADASEDYKDIGKTIEIIDLNNEKLVAGLHTYIARDTKDKMALGFGGYFMQTYNIRLQMMKFATGISVLGISKSNLVKIKIKIPQKQEQEKIAIFLSSIDEKIEKLTKKDELLQQYKKSIMQKIFSQEIRFKDDKGKEFPEWEEKELRDIFISIKGKGLSKNDLVDNGQNKCILYGELYTTYPEVIKEIKSFTNSNDGIKSIYGDLLIPCSTTTTGIDLANATALYEDNVLLGGDITILRFKKKGNSTFYAYFLTHFKKYDLAKFGQGSTIVHLYFEHFKNMKIKIPLEIKEQNKIANFLSSIDYKIEENQKILEKTKEFKKSLLQQMFV